MDLPSRPDVRIHWSNPSNGMWTPPYWPWCLPAKINKLTMVSRVVISIHSETSYAEAFSDPILDSFQLWLDWEITAASKWKDYQRDMGPGKWAQIPLPQLERSISPSGVGFPIQLRRYAHVRCRWRYGLASTIEAIYLYTICSFKKSCGWPIWSELPYRHQWVILK